MSLNEKVLEFAQKKRMTIVRWSGRKKGEKAECWDLAEEALIKSGGKTSWNYFEDEAKKKKLKSSVFSSKEYDYVWGKEVPYLSDVQPGDILQFRNHTQLFTEKSYTIEIVGSEIFTLTEKDVKPRVRGPQHTAIVVKNHGKGRMTVFEQHVLRPKPWKHNVVDRGEVYLKSGEFSLTLSEKITGSWAKKMKRIMISPTGRKLVNKILKEYKGVVKVEVTDQVRVKGTVWAYKPQAG